MCRLVRLNCIHCIFILNCPDAVIMYTALFLLMSLLFTALSYITGFICDRLRFLERSYELMRL
jgi:hypothetical protein